jgi:transposase
MRRWRGSSTTAIRAARGAGQSRTGRRSIWSCGGKASPGRSCWLEYKQLHLVDGLQYAQHCAHYRQWRQTQDVVLRQPYPAGEKIFVDDAGQTLPVLNRQTKELRVAFLFLAALGASCLTYAEAQETQTLPHWIGGHTRAVEYFQGVPAVPVFECQTEIT